MAKKYIQAFNLYQFQAHLVNYKEKFESLLIQSDLNVLVRYFFCRMIIRLPKLALAGIVVL